MHVKIFWHEGALPKKPMPEDSLITKSWEQELILRICAAIRSKQLNVESAIMIFDQDRDHIINAHDFQSTLLGTLNLQIHKDEIELLYQKMPAPLTRENFIAVFGPRIPGADSPVKYIIYSFFCCFVFVIYFILYLIIMFKKNFNILF